MLAGWAGRAALPQPAHCSTPDSRAKASDTTPCLLHCMPHPIYLWLLTRISEIENRATVTPSELNKQLRQRFPGCKNQPDDILPRPTVVQATCLRVYTRDSRVTPMGGGLLID